MLVSPKSGSNCAHDYDYVTTQLLEEGYMLHTHHPKDHESSFPKNLGTLSIMRRTELFCVRSLLASCHTVMLN